MCHIGKILIKRERVWKAKEPFVQSLQFLCKFKIIFELKVHFLKR